MLPLSWYLEYALRTLLRQGRRSLLAVFSLGTGVALLVSLQTLGLVLSDSLAVSGQMMIGADVIVSDLDDKLDASAQQPFENWRASGDLVTYTTVSVDQVFLKKRAQRALFELYIIDPARYPLYGTVPFLNPLNESLATLLRDTDTIVLSDQVARRMELAVGDSIDVGGSQIRPFRVTGIVASHSSRPMVFSSASLLGTGYMSRRGAARILSTNDSGKSDRILIKTSGPAESQTLIPQIQALSETYQIQDAEKELELTIEQIKGISTLLLYVALLALLTSGIAIGDTMLALVTQRQLEIAILKTLGMQERDLVVLFTLEAGLRGLAGGLLGIALGTALGFGLQTFAENFVGQPLSWHVYPVPIWTALVIGPLSAMAFSLLPVLFATGIRPVLLIRRQIERPPRRAVVAVLAVVLLTTAIMGIVAGIVIGNFAQGQATAYIALVLVLVLLLLFYIILWIFERLLGIAGRFALFLQLAVRSLSRRRMRSAITLTTLTIGVFAIALITLLASNARIGFLEQLNRDIGYNLIVFLPDMQADHEQLAELKSAPGLIALSAGNQAQSDLLRVNATLARELIEDYRDELRKQYVYGAWRGIQGRDLSTELPDVKILQGRQLVPSDAGRRLVLVPEPLARVLGLHIDDQLLLTVGGTPANFKLVGIYQRPNWSIGGWGFITSRETVSKLTSQSTSLYRLRVEDNQLEAANDKIASNLSKSLVVSTGELLVALTSVLERLALLPMLVAALALLVGSVMIANSVSLATLQRYEEIGILKALGATGGNILRLFWIENNLIGLLGAGIGVGLAIACAAQLGPAIFSGAGTNVTSDAVAILIPVVTALLVVGAATIVAVLPVVRVRPAAALRNE